jgi:hypothetical protein
MKKLIRVFAGITFLLNIPLTAQLRIGEGSLVKPPTPKIAHPPATNYHLGGEGSLVKPLTPKIAHPPATNYHLGGEGSLVPPPTLTFHPPDLRGEGILGKSPTPTLHLPDLGGEGILVKPPTPTFHPHYLGGEDILGKPPTPTFHPPGTNYHLGGEGIQSLNLLPPELGAGVTEQQEWSMPGSLKLEFDKPATAAESQSVPSLLSKPQPLLTIK